jgi:hypothetical protein
MTGDWQILNGIFAPSQTRDLAALYVLGDFDNFTHKHDKGMVIGNIIYKISTKPLVTSQMVARVILDTYKHMRPNLAGQPGVNELSDIYAAMQTATLGNPLLQRAVSEAWQELAVETSGGSGDAGTPQSGTSGGIPAPTGAPNAPAFIDGFPTGMCVDGGSVYRVNWQAVYGANRYEVYWRPHPEGGGFIYSNTVFGTFAETINWVHAAVKVKACNAAGCSYLSHDTFYQTDTCP